MHKPNTWFSMFKAQGATEARIDIYDEIGGWGIRANDFAAQLKELGDVAEICVHIHSPGGSVTDGIAIYNILRQCKARKVVMIDGLAASMASVIAMAGDEIQIPKSGLMMIHNPWTATYGDADELRKTADLLDKMRGCIVGAYETQTGKPREKLCELMDAETWYDGEQAVAEGFADKLADCDIAIAAKFDLSRVSGKLDPRAEKYLAAKQAEETMHERGNAADTSATQREQPHGSFDGILLFSPADIDKAKAEGIASVRAESDAAVAEAVKNAAQLRDTIAALTKERDDMAAKLSEARNLFDSLKAERDAALAERDLAREQRDNESKARQELLGGVAHVSESGGAISSRAKYDALWAQYHAMKTADEKTTFYRANKSAMERMFC